MTSGEAKNCAEIDVTLTSFDHWKAWREQSPDIFCPELPNSIVEQALQFGIEEPLTRIRILGGSLSPAGLNIREGLAFNGINCRQRAVLRVLSEIASIDNPHSISIYAPEAVTPIALRLRGIFPKFIGSEFITDGEDRAEMFPILHEDLCALSFPSNVFNAVMTNEVLEHVPDLNTALSEMARVLVPGGWHIGTAPLTMTETGTVRTKLIDGELHFLLEPEYHGDPFNDGGSLVFELPGWDILQRARDAGFSQAHMRFIISRRYGCVSSEGGIFVFCFQK